MSGLKQRNNWFHHFCLAARQMKTVSYQLSSMKCLDDGWTLRPPSPLLSNLGNNVFEMKPLDTSLFTDGKVNKSGKHISPGNQKIGNQQSECVLSSFYISSCQSNMLKLNFIIIGPLRKKTCLRGFRQSDTQTSLLSYSTPYNRLL